MSKWYAIKGPDGDWYHGEGVAFETPDAAWSSVANGNPMLLRVMDAEGYRCVEVNLVEVNTTTGGGGGEKGKGE